jgi:hypothetical protein
MEWSHASEAYENALTNFKALPFHDLCVIAAEWDADEPDGFNNDTYLESFKKYETQGFVDESALWDKVSGKRTCDNGGFNAWVCPIGCHTVSFNLEEAIA